MRVRQACTTGLLAACLLLCTSSTALAADPTAEDHQYVALVTSKSLPLCTATLVSPHAVLTTASCAGGKGEAEPKLVLVGAFNTHLDAFRRKGKYEIKYVDRAILHPGFKPKDARHDNLALLVLTKPSKLDPVKLPAASFAYPPEASDAEVLGFGSLSSDGVWPQRHADELTLLPEAECSGLQTAYGPSPEGAVDQACTALSHSFRACATGNVGAPLLLGGGGGDAAVQAGLLTSGFACSTDPSVASASSPALYTWLPRYADWIAAELAKIAEKEG